MEKSSGNNTQKQGKNVVKKVISIVLDVLFVCFFLLCAFTLFLSIASKKDSDGAMQIFGYEMRIVVSPSMEKCDQTDVSAYEIKDIPVKSLVFIQTVPEEGADEWYSSLKVGDVLSFRYVYTTQETITHRVTAISANDGGGYTITLQGDNKSDSGGSLVQVIDTSAEDSPNYVIGKVVGTSYVLGIIITALKSAWGIVLIVIVPCAIIIVFEIIRIVEAVRGDKNAQRDAENARKDAEIAELKRKLEEANSAKGQESSENSGDKQIKST